MKRQRNIFAVVIAIAQFATIGCCRLSAAADTRTAGNILLCVLPATAGGLVLGHGDDEGALELGKSLALTLGATYALKYAVNERRPNGDQWSFPSGHASFSFSVAEFMRKRYGWEYGLPAYVAAAFIGYSRVEADLHYPRDVVAGAGIGILSSHIFTKPYGGWQVSIQGDTEMFAVRLTRQF